MSLNEGPLTRTLRDRRLPTSAQGLGEGPDVLTWGTSRGVGCESVGTDGEETGGDDGHTDEEDEWDRHSGRTGDPWTRRETVSKDGRRGE